MGCHQNAKYWLKRLLKRAMRDRSFEKKKKRNKALIVDFHSFECSISVVILWGLRVLFVFCELFYCCLCFEDPENCRDNAVKSVDHKISTSLFFFTLQRSRQHVPVTDRHQAPTTSPILRVQEKVQPFLVHLLDIFSGLWSQSMDPNEVHPDQ